MKTGKDPSSPVYTEEGWEAWRVLIIPNLFPRIEEFRAILEKWLSGPDSVVPDARIDFCVPKATERRDLIAYFKR
jgi:hypothetical protein